MQTIELLTVREVGKLLRISKRQVYVLTERRELTAVRIGTKSIRFHKADIERYVANATS